MSLHFLFVYSGIIKKIKVMSAKHVTEKKKCQCYGCGKVTTRTYNFTLQKWARDFRCSKCYSESFRWYNF